MYDATSQSFSFFGTKVENCFVCIPLASIICDFHAGASTVSTCTFAKPGIATPHSLHPTIGICAQSVHLWTYLVSFWSKIALKIITHTPTTKLRQTKSLTWRFLQILHPCIHPPALLTFSNLDQPVSDQWKSRNEIPEMGQGLFVQVRVWKLCATKNNFRSTKSYTAMCISIVQTLVRQ